MKLQSMTHPSFGVGKHMQFASATISGLRASAWCPLGPVLESLMGMRGLPAAAAATALEDGVRGTNHPSKASAREEHSEEEQGGSEDNLSSLPSWTSSPRAIAQVPEQEMFQLLVP